MEQMDKIIENLSDLEVYSLTVIGEARGEPIEGQVAVASNIKNRIHNNPSRYKSYKDVCLERLQYSCWNENDPNRAYLLGLGSKMLLNQRDFDSYIRQCIYVTIGVDNGSIIDNTHGAIYYMTKKLFNSMDRPSWSKDAKNTVGKGNQIFFNL